MPKVIKLIVLQAVNIAVLILIACVGTLNY